MLECEKWWFEHYIGCIMLMVFFMSAKKQYDSVSKGLCRLAYLAPQRVKDLMKDDTIKAEFVPELSQKALSVFEIPEEAARCLGFAMRWCGINLDKDQQEKLIRSVSFNHINDDKMPMILAVLQFSYETEDAFHKMISQNSESSELPISYKNLQNTSLN